MLESRTQDWEFDIAGKAVDPLAERLCQLAHGGHILKIPENRRTAPRRVFSPGWEEIWVLSATIWIVSHPANGNGGGAI